MKVKRNLHPDLIKDKLTTSYQNLKQIKKYHEVINNRTKMTYHGLCASLESVDEGIVVEDAPEGSQEEKVEIVLLRAIDKQLSLVKENFTLAKSMANEWNKNSTIEFNEPLLNDFIDRVNKPVKTDEMLPYHRLDENARSQLRNIISQKLNKDNPSPDYIISLIDCYNLGGTYNALFKKIDYSVSEANSAIGYYTRGEEELLNEDNITYLFERFREYSSFINSKNGEERYDDLYLKLNTLISSANPVTKSKVQNILDVTTIREVAGQLSNNERPKIDNEIINKVLNKEQQVKPLTKTMVDKLNAIFKYIEIIDLNKLPNSVEFTENTVERIVELSSMYLHVAYDLQLVVADLLTTVQVANRNTLVHMEAIKVCKAIIDTVDDLVAHMKENSVPTISEEGLFSSILTIFKGKSRDPGDKHADRVIKYQLNHGLNQTADIKDDGNFIVITDVMSTNDKLRTLPDIVSYSLSFKLKAFRQLHAKNIKDITGIDINSVNDSELVRYMKEDYLTDAIVNMEQWGINIEFLSNLERPVMTLEDSGLLVSLHKLKPAISTITGYSNDIITKARDTFISGSYSAEEMDIALYDKVRYVEDHVADNVVNDLDKEWIGYAMEEVMYSKATTLDIETLCNVTSDFLKSPMVRGSVNSLELIEKMKMQKFDFAIFRKIYVETENELIDLAKQYMPELIESDDKPENVDSVTENFPVSRLSSKYGVDDFHQALFEADGICRMALMDNEYFLFVLKSVLSNIRGFLRIHNHIATSFINCFK